MLRTGAIAVAVAAILLVAGAGQASAASARMTCGGMLTADNAGTGASVGTTNFLIHYVTSSITGAQATQLADDAEAGRSLELGGLGYPVPPGDRTAAGDHDVTTDPGVSNPDNRTDVYVYPDSACNASTPACSCNGFTQRDSTTNPTSATAWIYVNPTIVANKSTVAHEFFHAVQSGIARKALGPNVLTEASASWIGALASNGDGGHPPQWLRNSRGATLDCSSGCAAAGDTVYAQWPFFELENEQGRPLFAGDAFSQSLGNPGGSQLDWMNGALGGGSALGNAVADYTATIGAADWTTSLLAGRFPTPTLETMANIGAGAQPTQSTTVDHLAARFYGFTATATTTLHLDWSWPGGSDVRASLARVGSPTGARLPVSANTTGAHADVAVTPGTTLIASFANPSITANGVPVSLTARTDAAASTGSGTTTAPRAPPAAQPLAPPPTIIPTLALSGKPKVKKSGRSRILTLTVSSSSTGFVVVSLATGKAKLVAHTAAKAKRYSRTFSLKSGTNKLSFKISSSAKKGRYTITLTPESSNFVTGTPISGGKVSVPKRPARRKARRAAVTRIY